ncbi:MAG: hypothetical protein RLZ98_2298 [Pseudomonadota bacterium]
MTKTVAELIKKQALEPQRPTREEAEEAVRTLLAWAGDDPDREGLLATPQRVVEAFDEYFAGYLQDPIAILRESSFDDIAGYDDIVLVKDIRVFSHCEHHIAPFSGTAHIAYYPDRHVAGFSRLARLVEVFARRLTTQETLTAQVAQALTEGLEPRGAAVMIEARHNCMTARSVQQTETRVVTTRFTGCFAADPDLQKRFIDLSTAR